ncbi:MAG: hypothetical protein D6725_05340 [Planctomycetota bacterium]|nr:MAG: hypothetical protein D6725_05340 [Planctomycetota bacterium]
MEVTAESYPMARACDATASAGNRFGVHGTCRGTASHRSIATGGHVAFRQHVRIARKNHPHTRGLPRLVLDRRWIDLCAAQETD